MKKALTIISLILTNFIYAQIPNYVPTNGLVGYWPFNGNANDESGHGNNGTVQGAILTSDRFSQPNRTYNFNGDDTIVITNPTLLPMADSSFSISAWFEDSTWLIRGTIIGWGIGSGGGSEANYIHVKESGGLEHYFWLNDLLDSTANLSGTWHNVIVTYNRNTTVRIMYIDGDSVTSNNAGSVNVSYTNISIGVQQAADGFFCGSCGFNGKIDDIGIWNRVLSPAEITTLFLSNNTTGLADIEGGKELTLYPNPTTSQLFIQSSEEIQQVNIYNATGSLVMAAQPQTANCKLQTANLTTGVYIAEIKTKEGSVRKRWLKM